MKKARKENVQLLRAVWAEGDPLDDPKLGERCRSWAAERQRLHDLAAELEQLTCPPSIILDSGNGIQVIWRLADPIEASQEYVAAIERLGRRIECALGGVENTSNVDRVLRIPGTVNWPNAKKRERGRGPAMTGIIYESGRSYSWHDLEALAAPPTATTTAPTSAAPCRPTPPTRSSTHCSRGFRTSGRHGTSPSIPAGGRSPSGWDQKFASALAREGFEPADLAAYLRAFRAHQEHEQPAAERKYKHSRADYVWRTIHTATRALGAPEEPEQEEKEAQRGPGASANGHDYQTVGEGRGLNKGASNSGAKEKPADDWPEPSVLGDPPPAPKFPTELLTWPLQQWVEKQAETMGVPCDVLALPALV